MDRRRLLYLASQSPRRRALIRQLRRPFRIVRSTYRERIDPRDPPSVNAKRNAIGKVRHARLPRHANGLVIGADTFLYFQGRIIGKPRTMTEARRLLQRLSGKSHWVYTGLCLLDAATGRWRASWERSKVTCKLLTDRTITRLFLRASPLDKAGGYAVQHERGELIARIEGSRSNVIGLPMERLRAELRALKRYIPPATPHRRASAGAVWRTLHGIYC